MRYNRGKKIMRKTVYMNLNKTILSGNICGEVTTRKTEKGECTRFNLAHNKPNGEAMFVNIVVLGNAKTPVASKIKAELAKGKPVTVEGRLDITKVEKDGKTFINNDLIADKVYPTESRTIEISDDGNEVKFVEPSDDLPY